MGVTRAEGKVAILNGKFSRNSLKHFRSYRGGDTAIVYGEKNGRPVAKVLSENESFCVNALGDSFARFATASVTAQPHGVIWRDVSAGNADRKKNGGLKLVCG
jgi:hypothetical protein